MKNYLIGFLNGETMLISAGNYQDACVIASSLAIDKNTGVGFVKEV